MGCGATAQSGKYVASQESQTCHQGQADQLAAKSQEGQYSPSMVKESVSISSTSENSRKGAVVSPSLDTVAKPVHETSVQVASSSSIRDSAAKSPMVSDSLVVSQQRLKGKSGLEARADELTGIYRRYEADASAALAAGPQEPLEPLVSPERVQLVAHILGADLAREPFLVPTVKHFLSSSLAVSVRENGRVVDSNVQQCLNLFSECRSKEAESWISSHEPNSSGKMVCVDCNLAASLYCPDCEDKFCNECFQKFHAKGNRTKHIRLDIYMVGFKTKETAGSLEGLLQTSRHLHKNSGHVVNRWHPFYDARGLRFFYNFETEKAVRNIPENDIDRPPAPPLPKVG
mmetsp:Transcript_133662/g.250051  ORF Transcript_133662/g.250051 Transcript_133662/m.250051 type:complete len:345 (-) Transcript_133662:117-1151(-)